MFASIRSQIVILFAFLFVFSVASASNNFATFVDVTDDKTYTPRQMETRGLLSARATGTTLCYPFRISLTTSPTTNPDNNSTIIVKTCYCQVTGVLTTASSNFLDSALATTGSANQTAFSEYLSSNSLTRAQGIANIKSSIVSGLNAKTTTCVYPANSIPNSCDACSYDCGSGYKACGTTCITTATTCKSGVAAKRDSKLKICPRGYSACATTYLGAKGGDGWECLNTASDLESCGGCQFPLADGVAGVDCTALPGTSMVGCVAGQCVVSTCLRGYTLSGNSCVKTSGSRKTTKRAHAKRAL